MSRVCHECGSCVENPFYSMSAVLIDRKNNRIAFSNLEVSLCHLEFDKISKGLHKTFDYIKNDLGCAVDGVTGACGGLSGSVQISSAVYARHENYRFFNREEGIQKLPKSLKDLFKNPKWCELIKNGDWKEVEWADKLYKELLIK